MFVLMIMISSVVNGGYSSSITTQEFTTKQACLNAGNQAIKQFNTYPHSIKATCVNK